jgi:sugar phosphate isomerase/epimerase
MIARLGVNLGFATNRYPEPDDWARIVGEELGLHTVMFAADLLSMFYPQQVIDEQVEEVRRQARYHGFRIDSIFTAAFTRVNHVCHPNPEIREQWVGYLRRLAQVGARMGARTMGSHFGIMSMRDYLSPDARERMTGIAVENWHRIAETAREAGIEYLIFEPMSVPREFAATIESTRRLLERVNRGIAIPMKLCLDVDHGDVSSQNPRDTDPYAWLEEFAEVSPVVHVKQSSRDKSAHRPFTADSSREGLIRAEDVLAALERGGATDVNLVLECSWRERWPTEYSVVSDLKQSVEYWRQYVKE